MLTLWIFLSGINSSPLHSEPLLYQVETSPPVTDTARIPSISTKKADDPSSPPQPFDSTNQTQAQAQAQGPNQKTGASPSPKSPDQEPARPPPQASTTQATQSTHSTSQTHPFRYDKSSSNSSDSFRWAKTVDSPPLIQHTEAHENHESIKWSSEQGVQSKTGTTTKIQTEIEGRRDPIFNFRRFGFEIKMGPYSPDFDLNCSGSCGHFEDVFGSNPKLFTVFAFDWQLINLAGPLSIGTSVGFWHDSAKAPFAPSTDGSASGLSKTDRTTFNVIPVTLLLGYRFSLLADRYHVPLVPFAKGGLVYGFFWSGDSNKKVSKQSNGKRFEGGSLGGQLEIGGMLQLDGFEAGASKKLQQNIGIRHAYVFGEYMLSRVDGLKKVNKVSVGDNTWLAGLAFEF